MIVYLQSIFTDSVNMFHKVVEILGTGIFKSTHTEDSAEICDSVAVEKHELHL